MMKGCVMHPPLQSWLDFNCSCNATVLPRWVHTGTCMHDVKHHLTPFDASSMCFVTQSLQHNNNTTGFLHMQCP